MGLLFFGAPCTFSQACDDELQPTLITVLFNSTEQKICTTWGRRKDKKGDQFLK